MTPSRWTVGRSTIRRRASSPADPNCPGEKPSPLPLSQCCSGADREAKVGADLDGAPAVGPTAGRRIGQVPAEVGQPGLIEPGPDGIEAEGEETGAGMVVGAEKALGVRLEVGERGLDAEAEQQQAGPGQGQQQALVMLDALDLGVLPVPAAGFVIAEPRL